MKSVKIGRREYSQKQIRNYRFFFLGLCVVLLVIGIQAAIGKHLWAIAPLAIGIMAGVAVLTCTVGLQEANREETHFPPNSKNARRRNSRHSSEIAQKKH